MIDYEKQTSKKLLLEPLLSLLGGFPGGSAVKNPLAMQEMRVRSLGWKDPLKKEIAAHSSILAWRIPWTEEPGSPWGCKESDVTERLRFLIKENIWF